MGKKLAGPPSSPISDWSVYMLHIKDRCQGMPAFRGQGGTWASSPKFNLPARKMTPVL